VAFGTACFVAAALELSLAVPGCLNPRPEELPSSSNDQGAGNVVPLAPMADTCDDNPLLAGCGDELPDTDINGEPIAASEPSPPASATGLADEGAADADASADAGAADAAAP
jgi:hypothetical protein